MSKLVFLKLLGDFNQGFQVTLDMAEDDKFPYVIGVNGSLRSAPELPQFYREWQAKYCHLESDYRHRLHFLEEGTQKEGNEESSTQECCKAAERLKVGFQDWLKCDEFRPIEDELLATFHKSDEIRLILQTEDEQLRKLPWEVWGFFQRFPNSEFGISPFPAKKPGQYTTSKKVRILAILGNDDGIDTQEDRKVLESLPQADACFLIKPTREQFNSLWSNRWDVLFFAGHSSSHGEKGYIYINQTDEGRLEISELEETLRVAIDNGLKLAIFNSCDGLGLARQLEKLHIPQVIVMREPVPDLFAQEFLKYFLADFSQGMSSYAAVRHARIKLRELKQIDEKFPGASWLPVICQNPTAKDFIWPSPKPVFSLWYELAQQLRQHSGVAIISGLIGVAIASTIAVWLSPTIPSPCLVAEKREANACFKDLSKTPLVVGFLSSPHEVVRTNDQQYRELKDYLKQKLGDHQDILIDDEDKLNYEQMQRKIASKELDIVFAHSPMNSWVAKKYGYTWLGSHSPYNSSYYRSVLFVRKDSPIQSLADIKATTMLALGYDGSASSFYFPVYELYGKKLSVTQVKSHGEIQELVRNKKAEVGASIELFVKQQPEFKIIYFSQTIPVAGVFISPKLSASDQHKIRQAFKNVPQKIKEKMSYKEMPEVNYDYIEHISSQTDKIIKCANFDQNPVQLFCK